MLLFVFVPPTDLRRNEPKDDRMLSSYNKDMCKRADEI